MKREDTRSLRALGALVSSGLCLTLVACPPSEVPSSEVDGGKPPTGGPDGGGGVELDGGGGGGGTDAGADGGQPDGGANTIVPVIAEIADGYLDDTFVLDGQGTENPEGRALAYAWEVDAPAGEACAGMLTSASSAVATFVPACRGEHGVTLTVSTPDGESYVEEASFEVLNRVPTLTQLRQEGAFQPGEAVIISAFVDDDDDDEVTCSAALADDNQGDPDGFVITPDPSGDCRFTVQTPARVETWKVEVVATDGIDDSLPATISLTPGNEAPVIDALELSASSIGYTCSAGSCASETVRVEVSASDDNDAFEDLDIELVDATVQLPEGAYVEVTPVAGEHGAFDVVVRRDDYGLLGGTYTLVARVGEQVGGNEVSQQIALDVTEELPVLNDVTQSASAVGYTCAAGTCATPAVRVEVDVTDDNYAFEDLEITLEDETLQAPVGAYVEVTPVPGEHGAFDVVVRRDDYGLLGGTYTLAARAAEQVGDREVSQLITLDVTEELPDFDGVTRSAEVIGYACSGGACAATTIRAVVEVTDDNYAFEDLDVDFLHTTAAAPAGTLVEITPVAGEARAFDIVIRRDSLGRLAGTYDFEVRVAEPFAGAPVQTETFSLQVVNAAPTISNVSAPDVQHSYSAGSATYHATVQVNATLSDPEGNALTRVLELVSCPAGTAGSADCGGANLDVQQSVTDSSLTLTLSTTDLGKLAGEYTFRIAATDAEGASATPQQPVAEVLNAAPTLAPGFVSQKQQSYVSGAHQAQFPFVVDADGDPLEVDVTVTCPGGGTAAIPGSCSSGPSIALANGVITITVPPDADHLGAYQLAGQVTDGAASLPISSSLTVQNTPPTLARTSNEIQSCNHVTSGTTVENVADCTYTFTGTGDDANEDPVTFEFVSFSGTGYNYPTPELSGAGNSFTATLDLETSYANFVDTFASQNQEARFRVVDPFGYSSSEAVLRPRLLNRAPILSSKQFRNSAGTGVPPLVEAESIWLAEFEARTNATSYGFAIDVNGSDPDGDPLTVSLSLDCGHSLVASGGGAPDVARPLPASGLIGLTMYSGSHNCGRVGVRRYWNFNLYGCGFGQSCKGVRCTLDGSSSSLSDGMTPSSLGADLETHLRLEDPAATHSHACLL